MKGETTRRIAKISIGLFTGSALCCLLIVIRDIAAGEAKFTYLIWNLFLAWIPFVIAVVLFSSHDESETGRFTPVTGLFILLWLLFYPNAPYIFTDFIHLFDAFPRIRQNSLASNREVLLWYDLVLNAAFAWMGHYIGLISLNLVHRTIKRSTTNFTAWTAIVCMIGMSGFGVFLGRFIRLNSWHIFTRPVETLQSVIPFLRSFNSLAFSSVYATFILISYLPMAPFSGSRGDGENHT